MEPKELTQLEQDMLEECARTHEAIHPGPLLAHISAMWLEELRQEMAKVAHEPHPGAALLSEMEALRKRVKELERHSMDMRAECAEWEEKFNDAGAQVATARAAALEEAHARELRLREAMERIAAHAAAMQADSDAASAEQLGFSYIRARALQALEKAK